MGRPLSSHSEATEKGGLSEIGKSAGKSGEQQINNLWPGRFV